MIWRSSLRSCLHNTLASSVLVCLSKRYAFVVGIFIILYGGTRGGNRTHVTPPYLDGALRVYKARPKANISNPGILILLLKRLVIAFAYTTLWALKVLWYFTPRPIQRFVVLMAANNAFINHLLISLASSA